MSNGRVRDIPQAKKTTKLNLLAVDAKTKKTRFLENVRHLLEADIDGEQESLHLPCSGLNGHVGNLLPKFHH